ncbi:hypothetical protein BDV96DRAFT_648476 [Lophiotrema nucula]|uniref:DUF7703 domain-containing protein n=1 Tax=Lophiotrema nucula TaxID=690887 RepID=A0A6A5Z361_9PLEO|nr:hypothetical protein BDV96DRAFT_648476 [Lophiotrema nucula]
MSSATPTSSSPAEKSTPAQGALSSAGAGITGGYTGDSLSLKIIIAFLIGLALYNAIELLLLVLVTFNKYRGLYFWSLVIAGIGIIPYALGFLIKFFQLLDPNSDQGYVAVVFLTIGWYMMVTGQSVVLWSRLHLLTNSRRVLRWSLWMIIINACLLHTTTTVLTFGSNSNGLANGILMHFVNSYNIMEKIQMVGFFVQELILSLIYIKETVRLLKLAETVKSDIGSFDGRADPEGHLRHGHGRKTMYQLLAINAIIIAMDIALLAVEFANLYLIETTLKGVVYSIKLKLEFAVLGKLVQLVQGHSDSQHSYHSQRGVSTGVELEKPSSGGTGASQRNASATGSLVNGTVGSHRNSVTVAHGRMNSVQHFPDFVDPNRIEGDVTHANEITVPQAARLDRVSSRDAEAERWRRRSVKLKKGSWIDEEMDKHNIG